MKPLLFLASLTLLIACGGKKKSTKTFPIKQVQISGKHAAYLQVPDGTCTLKAEMGTLYLLVDIKLLKAFADTLAFFPPDMTLYAMDESSAGVPGDFTLDYKAEALNADFFRHGAGQTQNIKFTYNNSEKLDLYDAINRIQQIKLEKVEFRVPEKPVNKDSLIYNNDTIFQPDAFIGLMEKEVNEMDSLLYLAEKEKHRTVPTGNNYVFLQKTLSQNTDKFDRAQTTRINRLDHRFYKLRERARADIKQRGQKAMEIGI